MNDERMLILKMIDEGKITVDEGVKLLKTVSRTAEVEEKLGEAAKKAQAIAMEVKDKAVELAKDAEPKVKKAAQVIGEKATEVASTIKDAIKKDDSSDYSEYADYVDIEDEFDEDLSSFDEADDIIFEEGDLDEPAFNEDDFQFEDDSVKDEE